jgi:hypothetical protein
VSLTSNNSLRLLYNLLALSKDQLNVARVRHIWVNLNLSVTTSGETVLDGGNLHGRGHGMCVVAALVPG